MREEPNGFLVTLVAFIIAVPLVAVIFSVTCLMAMLSWNHLATTLLVGYPTIDFLQTACVLCLLFITGSYSGLVKFGSVKR